MNLPNKLTVSRFVFTAVFVVAMVSEVPGHTTIALVLFLTASITDLMDGAIARRDKLVTNFGILMDPLADKILVCAAFITCVGQRWVPAWMAIIIVARELAITGLRMLAASQNLVLAAESAGKLKTTWQVISMVAMLVVHSYADWGAVARAIFDWPVLGRLWSWWFTQFALWMAVLTTLYSGGAYLWRNRQVYMRDV